MKAAVALLFAVLGLGAAGCGFYEWRKPGASDADFQQDSAACERSQSSTAEAFDACMRQRGWSLD